MGVPPSSTPITSPSPSASARATFCHAMPSRSSRSIVLARILTFGALRPHPCTRGRRAIDRRHSNHVHSRGVAHRRRAHVVACLAPAPRRVLWHRPDQLHHHARDHGGVCPI